MSGKHYKKKENKLRKLRDIVKTYSHLNFTSNSLCSLIPALHIVNDYADSGAINTYFRLRYVHNNKRKTTNPANVQHAGGNDMTSSRITTLHLPLFSNKHIIVHVLPQLQSISLLSI